MKKSANSFNSNLSIIRNKKIDCFNFYNSIHHSKANANLFCPFCLGREREKERKGDEIGKREEKKKREEERRREKEKKRKEKTERGGRFFSLGWTISNKRTKTNTKPIHLLSFIFSFFVKKKKERKREEREEREKRKREKERKRKGVRKKTGKKKSETKLTITKKG